MIDQYNVLFISMLWCSHWQKTSKTRFSFEVAAKYIVWWRCCIVLFNFFLVLFSNSPFDVLSLIFIVVWSKAPPPFRPGNPDLCGSHPLVASYYCRLMDLLCFVFTCMIIVFFCYLCNVCVPSVLWYCWLGLLTCKNRRPYNLYCVGGDVKPCSNNQSI